MAASRRARVKAHAKKIASNLARGTKGTAISAVTGAAAYKLGQMAYQQSDTIKNSPYALPIIYVFGGHLLKRKSIDAGAALIGVGAFMGIQAYEAAQAKAKQQANPAAAALKSAADAANNPGGKGMDSFTGMGAGEVVGWAQRMDRGAGAVRAQMGAGAVVNGPPIRRDSTPENLRGRIGGGAGAVRSAMDLTSD